MQEFVFGIYSSLLVFRLHTAKGSFLSLYKMAPPKKEVKVEKNLRTCIVPFCPTRAVTGLSRLPKDAVKKQKWLEILQIKFDTKLTPNSRVCHRHFRENSFANSKIRKKLKPTAEPTENLPNIPLLTYKGDLGLAKPTENLADKNIRKSSLSEEIKCFVKTQCGKHSIGVLAKLLSVPKTTLHNWVKTEKLFPFKKQTEVLCHFCELLNSDCKNLDLLAQKSFVQKPPGQKELTEESKISPSMSKSAKEIYEASLALSNTAVVSKEKNPKSNVKSKKPIGPFCQNCNQTFDNKDELHVHSCLEIKQEIQNINTIYVKEDNIDSVDSPNAQKNKIKQEIFEESEVTPIPIEDLITIHVKQEKFDFAESKNDQENGLIVQQIKEEIFAD